MSKKYEQLIEYIINDEEDKAKELFHDIVVETSRDIYENLIDEEDFAEEESVEDMSDAIEADEEGISEEEDEMEMDMEMPDMGDEEGEEEGEEAEEEELEDRVMDLEDALDELKAEFDAMMDDDKEEPEMEAVEEAEETVEEDTVEESEETVEESEEEVEESKDEDDDMDESKEEVVREYVDKVAQPSNNSEASTSPVAGKNDMGGKAVDPTGEEKGGSTPKVAPGKSYKNTAGGKAPMEKAPAPKTGE